MSLSDQVSCFDNPRSVVNNVLTQAQPEGNSGVLRRGFGRPELEYLDPFLQLDEYTERRPTAIHVHPHRGFETVTLMLEGAFTHQDFAGHTGTVHKGDVQWMTAGRGIIHSEKPVNEETQKRLQIWINLHSKDKMIEPYYQELLSADIKTAEKDGVHVRVIAGEFMGLKSSISTRTPTMLLDFTLKPRSIIHQPIPHSWNAFIYVIEGECVICASNPSVVTALHVGVLGPGEGVSVWNKGSDILRFVLIGGEPINEPVVQYEQLVMNTRAELEQAFEDYKYHKNGFEMPKNG